jgi:hypothetical protein
MRLRLMWVAVALSLAFGVWRSHQPEALADFEAVRSWTGTLASGEYPYNADSNADYPPWALVTLAPLLVLPDSVAGWGWIFVNIGLALAVAWRLAQVADVPRATRWALVALILMCSPFRVLSQFSVLSFALGLWGASLKTPTGGGVLLGLSLMKPQVGGALLLAHVCLRDWRRVVVAVGVPVALTGVAALWTGTSPLVLMADWLAIVESLHGGDGLFPGHTELEPWLVGVIPGVTTVAGSVALGVVLLVPAMLVAGRLPAWRQVDTQHRLQLYAWCGAVSLLATRHLAYDFLLLLPLVAAWRSAPLFQRQQSSLRHWVWITTVLLLVAQVPGWWRRVFEPIGSVEWAEFVLSSDRALAVAVYGVLSWFIMQLNMTK